MLGRKEGKSGEARSTEKCENGPDLEKKEGGENVSFSGKLSLPAEGGNDSSVCPMETPN